MKVLTLTQPWAMLVAIGAKYIETRSWATKYRGPLLIHAAQGPGSLGWMQMQHICRHEEPFKSALAGILQDRHPGEVLPRGAIVARCELRACVPTEKLQGQPWCSYGPRKWDLTDQERAFGDYTPGRYAWLLSDVQALPEPIPAKGQLGLWEYEL